MAEKPIQIFHYMVSMSLEELFKKDKIIQKQNVRSITLIYHYEICVSIYSSIVRIIKRPETSTNGATYNLPERGGRMKKEPVIENFIEIDGKDILIDSLPDEDRKRIGLLIQDRIMELAGYKRKAASG